MKDESTLLKAAKRLDKDALTAVFDMYAPMLYNYVLRLCQDPVESDHIVGDLFAKLVDQFANGQGPVTNLKAYLFRMAYHSVVDGARQNQHFAPLEAAIDTPAKLKKGSVQAEIEEQDLMETFRTILNNELSDIQRHVIILRFMEGFSLRETAAIVDKKVNHVKVIQNRGVAKLRKSLERQLWTVDLAKSLFTHRNGE